jgi:catecholate siderophore receptor
VHSSTVLAAWVRDFLRQKTVICAAAAIAAPVAAWGADSPSSEATTLPRIRVEGDAPQPEDYGAQRSTSATRTDTPLVNVPQSVTVVTGKLMADQSIDSMAEAVRYVPGVTMGQGEGNRDQPTIRGNNTTADFFVDSMRDDAQHFRDVYNAERLEVLKGPNAMIFGRGGGGGVINRVTKQASWNPVQGFTIEGGSFNKARATVDVGQGLTEQFAVRLNGLYEDSESYRDHVELKRYGVNPTAALALGENTVVHLGYEYFSDERTADRGVPSYLGRPLRVDESTFFGDPDLSHSDAYVDAFSALIEHEAGAFTVRNRTRYADYDKYYQNVFPGAVNAAGDAVGISAYNSRNDRNNLFNQTDLIWRLEAAGLRHTVLAGVEFGRQRSDNFRNTGFFNNTATSFTTPLTNPTISVPITFRQSATDADNHVEADIAAIYVQDQIEFSSAWQAVLGLRYDNFSLDFENHRTGEQLSRDDDLVSPRAGLIFKPAEDLSLYASYSVSHLPSSGDQFSSLTATTSTLEPEEFTNYELGAKWDLHQGLALTTAVFQLERTNTSAPDPNNPARIVQTGSQRTRGFELEASGALTGGWSVMGGYAYQDAEITDRTTAAPAGATLPLTPHHTFSLWNRYDFTDRWGVGLGVIYQDDMYAGIDNTVTLPSFTRVDAAAYFAFSERLRVQLNVENLLDEEYSLTAHSNNNITPGSPLAFGVGLSGSF